MSEKKDIFWRAYLVYFGFVIVLLVVIFKTISIQMNTKTSTSNTLTASDDKIPKRISLRFPRRGEILDINSTPLVTSISFYEIHLDATVVDQKIFDDSITDLSRGLSEIFPAKSSREWQEEIQRARFLKNRFLKIKSKATNEERRLLNKLPIFNLGRMKGGLIDNQVTSTRKRPYNELLKRTLGYYQPANKKSKELRVGIEGAYNEYLAGVPGQEIEQEISTGWKKTGQIIKEAVEGADVITSIDKEIQEVAHSELLAQLKAQGAKHGCAVVMDVKTGFVKAIINLTLSVNGDYYETYNHAIGTREVPGSTFKLASLMAGLEDKKFLITDIVRAGPKYTFFNKSLNEAHNANYGDITIKSAFEKSSNVISKVIYNAYKNDPKLFVDRLKSFGLSAPLGLDIEGEASPTMYEPGSKSWSGISLAWMAVGYEIQQTPLQTLAFYNAVANNGKFVKPQFVKEIRRGAEVLKEFQPVVINPKICSDNTLKILQSCLAGVMKEGTGKRLTSSYFDIAGKTGTAEILNDDMRYGNKGEKKYLASFVGYFPVKDPIYSCIVSIAASGENIYGATVSGTVFAAIANKVYATSLKYHRAVNEHRIKSLDFPTFKDGNLHDLLIVMNKLHIQYTNNVHDEWVNIATDKNEIAFSRRSFKKGQVPDVLGMSARDAVYLIESNGMSVNIIGYGKVINQSIPAGSPAFNGGLIELTLK